MVLSPLVLVLRGLGIGIGIEGQNFDSIGIGIGIEGPSIDFWYWYWYWYCNPCFHYAWYRQQIQLGESPKIITDNIGYLKNEIEVSENVLKDRIIDRRTQALALGIIEAGIYGLYHYNNGASSLEHTIKCIPYLQRRPLVGRSYSIGDSATTRTPKTV